MNNLAIFLLLFSWAIVICLDVEREGLKERNRKLRKENAELRFEDKTSGI